MLLLALLLAQAVPDPQREQATLVPPRLQGEAPLAEYPAARTGAARVVLQIDVDTSGAPQNILVLTPPQPGFDEAALAAAHNLRFEPATQGGKPVTVRMQYAVNFTPPPPPEPPTPKEKPVTLAGQVRERGTRRKLSGIEITAAGESAITGKDGRFELRGLPQGQPIDIVIAAPGYQRFTARETIPPGEKLEVEYRLQPLYVSPYEATVEGERERREISHTVLSTEETDKIPGAQGDALKVVEDLPGVARTSPIGGGLLVIRGSTPGDSLVYLDGEPIPLLFHFGAFSSTFNPDLLAGIDYIPGNFSSSYGDLTGGLVELKTRKLRDEPHGYANFNVPLESSAQVEGALAPGLTVALAGRKSYIGEVFRAVLPSSDSFALTVAPSYYDAQLRIDYQPLDSAHKLGFIALTSDDTLGALLPRPPNQDPNLSGSVDAETAFQQLRFKHEWRRGGLSLESVAMFERLGIDFVVGPSNFHLIGHDTFLRSTLNDEISPELSLAGGVDIANRRLQVSAVFRQSFLFREGDFNTQGPRPDDAVISLAPVLFNRFSPGGWIEARWRPLPSLTLTPGLRADLYHYSPREPNTTGTVTPRLTARWETSEKLALKAGIGLYSEGARNGDAAQPFGNPAILPQRAWQATLGVEVRPLESTFLSVEAFYKGLWDLAVKTDALQTVNGVTRPELLDNAGSGRVYGLEVLLRRELARGFFGWIAYTLMRSDRIDRPGEPERVFDFDQTHNLTAVASWEFAHGWQLGGRMRVISGNPDTPVIGSRYLSQFDAYLPIYGAIDSLRLPTFHQLDVRIDRTWTFDSWMLDAYLDVLNVYNHRSIEGSVYSYDFSQHAYFEGLTVIPALGVKGSF